MNGGKNKARLEIGDRVLRLGAGGLTLLEAYKEQVQGRLEELETVCEMLIDWNDGDTPEEKDVFFALSAIRHAKQYMYVVRNMDIRRKEVGNEE